MWTWESGTGALVFLFPPDSGPDSATQLSHCGEAIHRPAPLLHHPASIFTLLIAMSPPILSSLQTYPPSTGLAPNSRLHLRWVAARSCCSKDRLLPNRAYFWDSPKTRIRFHHQLLVYPTRLGLVAASFSSASFMHHTVDNHVSPPLETYPLPTFR